MRFKFEFEKNDEVFIRGKTKNSNLIEKVMIAAFEMAGYSEQAAQEQTESTKELLK